MRISTFDVKVKAIIREDTERARSYINAGGSMIKYARTELTKILKLDPDNKEAKELLIILER